MRKIVAFLSRVTVLTLAAVAIASCGTPAPPTAAAGKIAFTSKRDGNSEIYVMNADGTGQTRLTNNSAEDAWPAWSP